MIAEILGHGQTREADPQTGAGRLVHLPVDQAGLVEHTGLLHLQIEVVALARPLADTAENRVAAVLGGDIIDKLHDGNGLADPGAAEETGLTALDVRGEKVDDLDAGLEDLDRRVELVESGGFPVDRIPLLGCYRRPVIDRLAEDVEDASEGLLTDRYGDGLAGIDDIGPPDETVRRRHGDGADLIARQVLLDLGYQLYLTGLGRRRHL